MITGLEIAMKKLIEGTNRKRKVIYDSGHV
jgi:hypothetical protein